MILPATSISGRSRHESAMISSPRQSRMEPLTPVARGGAGRRGSVLIVVLWVSFGLVSLALYFAHSMSFELRASDNRVAGVESEQAIAGAARYVSNILAQEFSSLTYDQYNSILFDFHETCAEPAAKDVGADLELGNSDPHLDDFVSPNTAKLLRSFSARANRSILHPLDRERWNEFLAAAYREGAKLDPSMLKRWLIEEEKWPEDEAITLAIEYEHARDLLQVFQSQA